MSWTFPYPGETEELNKTTRVDAPGSFVQLSDGYTHYELGGAENGQPVVLVHGFSVPYFIWDPTFEFLTQSNFRVLRYDLFGRGFSDRPKSRYNIDLFCQQLRELLDTLGFEQCNLIGLSMGGPIVSTFTARYPKRVKKLVLVDPTGARPITLRPLLKILTTPGFGELIFGLFGNETLVKGVADDFFGPELVSEFQQKFRIQMQYKGFKRAILSTIRNDVLGNFIETYEQIGRSKTLVTLFWGRNDQTVPFAHNERFRAAIPQTQFHTIEDCRHIPHYEKPEEVNPLLLKFLEQE